MKVQVYEYRVFFRKRCGQESDVTVLTDRMTRVMVAMAEAYLTPPREIIRITKLDLADGHEYFTVSRKDPCKELES